MVLFNTAPFSLLDELGRAWRSTDLLPSVATTGTPAEAPRARLVHGDAGPEIEMIVPGFGPEHVQVTFEDDLLVVRGERTRTRTIEAGTNGDASAEDAEPDGQTKVDARFERRFRVPRDLDVDNVEAHIEHGVLRIRLPKRQAETRTIAVRGN